MKKIKEQLDKGERKIMLMTDRQTDKQTDRQTDRRIVCN